MRFDSRNEATYHARAMSDLLRDSQSLKSLAENRQAIEIEEELTFFTRLAESVDDDLSAHDSGRIAENWRARQVRGRLQFAFRDRSSELVELTGSVQTRIPAVCQRCLNVFDMRLETGLHLLIGAADEQRDLQQLPAEFEFWEVPGDTLRPIDLVDEALVMALPLAARHDDADNCVEFAADAEVQDKITPFAALRSLMDNEVQD